MMDVPESPWWVGGGRLLLVDIGDIRADTFLHVVVQLFSSLFFSFSNIHSSPHAIFDPQ